MINWTWFLFYMMMAILLVTFVWLLSAEHEYNTEFSAKCKAKDGIVFIPYKTGPICLKKDAVIQP